MSEQPFIFENWFDSLKTSGKVNDEFKQSIEELLEHKLDASQFVTAHILIPNNLGFIEKNSNNKYFVDIQVPRVGDIVTGFVAYSDNGSDNLMSELDLKLIMNGLSSASVNEDTKIAMVCAIYSEIKIRVTFEKDPFPFRVKYTSYVLESNLRKELINKHFTCDNIRYANGVVTPLAYV